MRRILYRFSNMGGGVFSPYSAIDCSFSVSIYVCCTHFAIDLPMQCRSYHYIKYFKSLHLFNHYYSILNEILPMIYIRRDMGCFGTKSRSIWLRVFKSSSLHQIWDTRPEVYDFDQMHHKWATRLVMGVSFDLLIIQACD